MYISAMLAGMIDSTPLEMLLQKVRTRVVTSRIGVLDEKWRYELRSPFWRIYVNKSPGAFIEYQGIRWNLAPHKIHLIPA